MGTTIIALVLCTINLGFVGISLACNGYQLKVNHIQNCHPQSIIKLQKVGVTLDNDCNIITSGCIVITKKFQTAKAHYILSKPPLPAFEGDLDLCEAMKTDNDDAKEVSSMFNAPKQCPVNPSKFCGGPNNKINISKYKNRLVMAAGTISYKTNVTHNNGVSCIDVNITLERPRRG